MLGRRAVSVVIDMRGVDFIGTECLALLLVGYTKALRAGHGYQVVRGQGHVRRVLEDTGLSAAAEPRAATAGRAATAAADADAEVSWLDLLVDPFGFVKQGAAPRAEAGGEELRPL